MPRQDNAVRARNPETPLKSLCRLLKTHKDEVLDNPIWRRLRDKDPDFLAGMPSQLRLELLRCHWSANPRAPWAAIYSGGAHDKTRKILWPAWHDDPRGNGVWKSNGIWKIDDYKLPSSTGRNERYELTHGWSFEFNVEEPDCSYRDDAGEESEGARKYFRLDEILKLLFESPDADPRAEFIKRKDCRYEPRPVFDEGYEMSCSGITLFGPRNEVEVLELEVSEEAAFFDEDEIQGLTRIDGGRYSMRPQGDISAVRPLFLKTPQFSVDSAAEGHIEFQWDTDYFVPEESSLSEGSQVAVYQKEHLNLSGSIYGISIYDDPVVVWKFKKISDLEPLIAKALESKQIHELLMPIYFSVLFGGDEQAGEKRS